jgi:hypothetical protein
MARNPVDRTSPVGPAERQAEQAAERAMQPELRAHSPSRPGIYPDLDRVRIHTDGAAARSAATLNARAYTFGTDVVFGRNEYRPNTAAGIGLLAHELTHVLQQTGPGALRPVVQRAPAVTPKARLESARLAGDRRLQAAFHNSPAMSAGEVNEGVKTLQRALREMGYPMPISFAKTGDADGIFGPETRTTVLQFQVDQALIMREGIAGHETLGRLDELLGGRPGPAPPVPPAPPAPTPPTPGPPAPSPPAMTLSLRSLTFKSDHGLLKDERGSWERSDVPFPTPHWQDISPGGRSAPISHTRNRSVVADAVLDASPEGDGTSFELRGESASSFLSFKAAGTLRAGRQVVSLTSGSTTPNAITDVREQAISWFVVTSGRRQPVGRSLGHEIFVTMDRPREPGEVTYRRMAKSVELAGSIGTLVPHDLVHGIMLNFGNYNLDVQLENAWTLADNLARGAQCIDIVRFVQGIINQVGCPGIAEAKLIWAKAESPQKAEETGQMGPSLQNHPAHPAHPTWGAALIDIQACPNNFEAALKFTETGTRYYPGGVPLERRDRSKIIYSDPDQVLRIFQFLAWIEFVPGSKNFHIEEVLASYQGRRVPALPFLTVCHSGRLG